MQLFNASHVFLCLIYCTLLYTTVSMFRCLPVCKHLYIYQTVDEEELQDVQEHSPQRNLQWPQMRVGCEQRDEAQGTENVRNGKHCFSYKRWMPHLPLVPGFTTAVLNRTMDGEHVK